MFWALSFAVQVALVPIAIEASSQWLGNHLKEMTVPYEWLDYWVNVAHTLLPVFIGFLLGYATKPLPSAIREPGRWIFVVPAAVLPVVLIAAYVTNLHDLLFSVYGQRGAEYEGLGAIGLIFPAGGYCLYSIGVRVGDRHSNPLANVFKDEDAIPEGGPRRAAAPSTTDPDTDMPRGVDSGK